MPKESNYRQRYDITCNSIARKSIKYETHKIAEEKKWGDKKQLLYLIFWAGTLCYIYQYLNFRTLRRVKYLICSSKLLHNIS